MYTTHCGGGPISHKAIMAITDGKHTIFLPNKMIKFSAFEKNKGLIGPKFHGPNHRKRYGQFPGSQARKAKNINSLAPKRLKMKLYRKAKGTLKSTKIYSYKEK